MPYAICLIIMSLYIGVCRTRLAACLFIYVMSQGGGRGRHTIAILVNNFVISTLGEDTNGCMIEIYVTKEYPQYCIVSFDKQTMQTN